MSLEEFNLLSDAFSSGTPARDFSFLENLSDQSRDYLKANPQKWQEEANKVIETCSAENFQILYPQHPLYPKGCFELEDPPLFLSLEGDWPALSSIAIVGSREPSRYAVDWIGEHLPAIYATNDFLVVSGGARGIDLAAHLTAVRSGRPTLVFLPSGLRNLYPKDLHRYRDIILECGGGFVSELAPEAEMRKFHFIKRNRLIVASSDLIFVAEARRKSGSMLTAGIASGMSKTICTLPASPSMTCAQGSLDLIYGNAFPIRDSADLRVLLEASSRRV